MAERSKNAAYDVLVGWKRHGLLALAVSALIVSALIVSSCTTTGGPKSPEDQKAAVSEFPQGNLNLDCGFPCVFAAGYNAERTRGLYQAGLWDDLVKAVVSDGLDYDTGWFLLGEAARAKGFTTAADRYYRQSIATRRKCRNLSKTAFCDSDMANLAQRRLHELAKTAVAGKPSAGAGPALNGVAPVPQTEARYFDPGPAYVKPSSTQAPFSTSFQPTPRDSKPDIPEFPQSEKPFAVRPVRMGMNAERTCSIFVEARNRDDRELLFLATMTNDAGNPGRSGSSTLMQFMKGNRATKALIYPGQCDAVTGLTLRISSCLVQGEQSPIPPSRCRELVDLVDGIIPIRFGADIIAEKPREPTPEEKEAYKKKQDEYYKNSEFVGAIKWYTKGAGPIFDKKGVCQDYLSEIVIRAREFAFGKEPDPDKLFYAAMMHREGMQCFHQYHEAKKDGLAP